MTQLGQVNSYISTLPDKRMVTDRILMLDPYDIVAYNALGTDVGKFNMANRDGKQYEWLEDTFNAVTDKLDAVITTTTTTMTLVTDALAQVGDVWLIESEKVWVSAVAASSVTIVRGYGATSDAPHADSTAMTLVSRARLDGSAAGDSPSTEITSGYNFTQIFQRTVNVARTKQRLAEYGVASWEDYLIDKYMKELMMLLNKVPYRGERLAGSASAPRAAGGLRTFITNNLTYATSTAATAGTALALTRKNIDDTLQNIWDDGGSPNLILTGAWAQRKINDFYEGFITTERSEMVGGNLIKKLLHPISGTTLDVLVDRHCPTNEMWILERDKIAFYPFDPFFYESLAKDGDYIKGEVVGEYGFVVASDKHHGAVLEFSTTA